MKDHRKITVEIPIIVYKYLDILASHENEYVEDTIRRLCTSFVYEKGEIEDYELDEIQEIWREEK